MTQDQQIVDEAQVAINRLMLQVREEFSSRKINPRLEPISGSVWLAFHLGGDYYTAAYKSLRDNLLLSGTALARTGLEIIIDLFYIHDNKPKESKQLKYSAAYVKSIDAFRQAMNDAGKKNNEGGFVPGSLNNINPWTGASMTDRIRASGPIISNMYDLLSYSNHANPGMAIYFLNKELRDAQTILIRKLNLLNAIFLIKFCINYAGITKATHSELDELADRMGFEAPAI